MLRLEKFARAPENTDLKGPGLENLCNNRVNFCTAYRLNQVMQQLRNYYKICYLYFSPGTGETEPNLQLRNGINSNVALLFSYMAALLRPKNNAT